MGDERNQQMIEQHYSCTNSKPSETSVFSLTKSYLKRGEKRRVGEKREKRVGEKANAVSRLLKC